MDKHEVNLENIIPMFPEIVFSQLTFLKVVSKKNQQDKFAPIFCVLGDSKNKKSFLLELCQTGPKTLLILDEGSKISLVAS